MFSDLILAFSYFLVIGANLLLGIVILYRGVTNKINISFSLIVFFLSLWVLSSYLTFYYANLSLFDIASFWFKMRYITIMPVPAIFIFFSLIFPEDTPPSPKTYLLFIPTAGLYVLQFMGKIAQRVELNNYENFLVQIYGRYVILFAIYYIFYFGATLTILAWKYFRSKGLAKVQIKYVWIGTFLPIVIGGLGNFFLPLLNINPGVLFNIAPLSTIFIAVMISIAIVKHKILGYNYFFGKGIVYTLVAGFVSATYFGFLYILTRYFYVISNLYSLLFYSLFFLTMAIMFGPIKDWVQRLVDIFFFKSKISYEKTLKQVSLAISYMSNKEKLIDLLTKLLVRRMGLIGAVIFLKDPASSGFVAKGIGGISSSLKDKKFQDDDPLIKFIETHKKYFFKSDIENFAVDIFKSDAEKEEFKKLLLEIEQLKANVCFPVFVKGELNGFVFLGKKISGDIFDDQDIAFVNALIGQLVIFLQNFSLVEKERERSERIAREKAKEKYEKILESTNKELIETKEELIKQERFATVTMLAVSSQKEINLPVEKIINQLDELEIKSRENKNSITKEEIRSVIKNIEEQAKKIRDLLHNLSNAIAPFVKG